MSEPDEKDIGQFVFEETMQMILSSGLTYMEMLGLTTMLEATIIRNMEEAGRRMSRDSRNKLKGSERPDYFG